MVERSYLAASCLHGISAAYRPLPSGSQTAIAVPICEVLSMGQGYLYIENY